MPSTAQRRSRFDRGDDGVRPDSAARGQLHGLHEHRDLPDPAPGEPRRGHGQGRDPATSCGKGQPDGHHPHSAQKWCKGRCSSKGEFTAKLPLQISLVPPGLDHYHK